MAKDIDDVSKVIIKWKKACLFLKRASDDTWELPGGHLNVGENFKQGAVREVFEETGIKLNKLKVVLKQKDFCLFVAKCKILKIKLSNEHTDYRWILPKDINRIKLSKPTKLNIKTILNTI